MIKIESKTVGAVSYDADEDCFYIDRYGFNSTDEMLQVANDMVALADYVKATKQAAKLDDMSRDEAEAEAYRIWGEAGCINDKAHPYGYRVSSSIDGKILPYIYGNGRTWKEAFANAKNHSDYKEPEAIQ